jgi:hypothetical protein
MKSLVIDPTSSTPEIRFNDDGRLLMAGRSLPENVQKFYGPVVEWAEQLSAPVVRFDINLEYLNSASSKKLLELLKVLDANNKISEFIINWHYEADDEDGLENGQIYEDLLIRAVFRYHEYSDAK